MLLMSSMLSAGGIAPMLRLVVIPGRAFDADLFFRAETLSPHGVSPASIRLLNAAYSNSHPILNTSGSSSPSPSTSFWPPRSGAFPLPLSVEARTRGASKPVVTQRHVTVGIRWGISDSLSSPIDFSSLSSLVLSCTTMCVVCSGSYSGTSAPPCLTICWQGRCQKSSQPPSLTIHLQCPSCVSCPRWESPCRCRNRICVCPRETACTSFSSHSAAAPRIPHSSASRTPTP